MINKVETKISECAELMLNDGYWMLDGEIELSNGCKYKYKIQEKD